MIKFAYLNMFLLLLLPFIVFYLFPRIKGQHGGSLRVPFLNDLINIKTKTNNFSFLSKNSSFTSFFKFAFIYIIWILLVCAAARPQIVGDPYRLKTENRDIMLVIDISTSMLQPDFFYNNSRLDRLTAVKKVVSDFIKDRKEDRVGLVLFGTKAYLQSPLTFDKAAVSNILLNTDAGMAGNSTSIGDALGLALKNLKNEKNKQNKVIILLSDGENNDGSLSMAEAINLAEKEEIKIYTIGVGSESMFMNSIFAVRNNALDEEGLKELAQKTHGDYFRASDFNSLFEIYKKINQLEPQKNDSSIVQEKKDIFYMPLLIALCLSIILLFIPRSSLK